MGQAGRPYQSRDSGDGEGGEVGNTMLPTPHSSTATIEGLDDIRAVFLRWTGSKVRSARCQPPSQPTQEEADSNGGTSSRGYSPPRAWPWPSLPYSGRAATGRW